MMNQSKDDKLAQFFNDFEVIEYSKGQIITYAGEDPIGVSLLVDGTVEQYDITPEGNRITVNIFRPQAFFPMSWAINKTPNSYFYAAVNEVKLRRAPADVTVSFLRDNPDVLFDLLSRVYKGTDALLQRLVITARGIASSRLIFELLIEAHRFGKEIDSSTRLITARQNALAARSGLARETVNRELHKLEQANLVTLTKQGIELNIAELEKKLDITV